MYDEDAVRKRKELNVQVWDWMIGLAGSSAIAWLAYAKRSLSVSGATGAVVVGTVLYGAGNAYWYVLMIVFFATSTILTKWKQQRKAAAEAVYEKTGQRDWGQVAANGGIGVLLCIGNAIWSHPGWFAAYAGIMASVTADTWATEIGSLSSKGPRSILTGRKVPAGTSGGVTAWGLAAAASGALLIGLTGWLLLAVSNNDNVTVLITDKPWGAARFSGIAALSGFAAACADSLMGACWQAMHKCSVCGRETERREHCGMQTAALRGISWMNNDAVNVISSLIGALLAYFLI